MQTIPNLVPHAIEPDILQRSSFPPRMDPERKDPLIGLSELPSAGHDAAAIDPDGEVEGLSIFERQGF